MKTYTDREVAEILQTASFDFEDNQGQPVSYSGVFKWADGTYHDEPKPDENDFFSNGDTEG